MKKLVLLPFLFLFAYVAHAQDGYSAKELADKGFKRYNIKSGVLKSKYSGIMEGEQILTFDMWGWRESTKGDKTTNVMGMKTVDKTSAYLDGINQYTYNPDTKTATKLENTILKNIIDGGEAKSLTDVGEKMLKDMGGEKVGTETILGKTCDVYEIKSYGTKTWVWNGVTLKLEMNMMGMTYAMEATSFEEGVSVNEADVKLPAGATITDSPALPPGFNFGGMGK